MLQSSLISSSRTKDVQKYNFDMHTFHPFQQMFWACTHPCCFVLMHSMFAKLGPKFLAFIGKMGRSLFYRCSNEIHPILKSTTVFVCFCLMMPNFGYQAYLGTRPGPEQTWLTSFGCCWTERWNERGSSSLRWSDDQMYCTSIFVAPSRHMLFAPPFLTQCIHCR